MIGSVLCALPRSKKLGLPGGGQSTASSGSYIVCISLVLDTQFAYVSEGTVTGVLCVSSGQLISGSDPPVLCELHRNSGIHG